MGGYQTVTGWGECTECGREAAVGVQFFLRHGGDGLVRTVIHPCPNGCVETQEREYWNESGGEGCIYFEGTRIIKDEDYELDKHEREEAEKQGVPGKKEEEEE